MSAGPRPAMGSILVLSGLGLAASALFGLASMRAVSRGASAATIHLVGWAGLLLACLLPFAWIVWVGR